MSLPPVKPERSHWRDLSLNDLHRKWGWNCPATDIDFIEYDDGRAVAVFEYKHESAAPAYPSAANVRALVDLCTRAGVPVFGVRYANDKTWWRVKPLNRFAAKWVPAEPAVMSQREFVTLLYKIRGRSLPTGLSLPDWPGAS